MSDETAVPETTEVESPSAEDSPAETESPSAPSDEVKADEAESPSTKAAEEDAEPEEWKNFLRKFNGDKGKAAKHYWDSQKSNAQLAKEAKEAKELKAKLEAIEKAKSEKPAEPPAALKEVDEYITARNKALEKTLPQQELKLFNDYRAQEKEIHRLEYELERAEDIDKRSIKADLRVAQADLKTIERDIREVQGKAKNYEQEIQQAKQYRKNLEKQLEDQTRAQQEQEANVAAFMESFPDEINSYIEKHAPTFNLESDDELRDTVYEYLMGYAAHYRGTDEDADKDWEGLVKAKLEREAKRIDKAGRAHYAKVSKEIKKVATPTKAAIAPSANTNKPANTDGLTPGMQKAREYLRSKGL